MKHASSLPPLIFLIKNSFTTLIKYKVLIAKTYAPFALVGLLNVFIQYLFYKNTSLTILFSLLAVVVNYFFALSIYISFRDRKKHFNYQEILQESISLYPKFLITLLIYDIIFYLSLFFFVIPGLIFAVYFSFASWIVVNEKKFGLKALQNSREMVRGEFWQIAFYRFLSSFLIFLPAIVSLVSIYKKFKDLPIDKLQNLPVSPWPSLIALIVIPIIMIFNGLLYEYTSQHKKYDTTKKFSWWYFVIPLLGSFSLLFQ